ncbi:MAG: hypothetical protein M1817_000362 [Caeruleum heppii]|nr:MAG: hypothetical protein M1817_000362 [Caeruleum heppii]
MPALDDATVDGSWMAASVANNATYYSRQRTPSAMDERRTRSSRSARESEHTPESEPLQQARRRKGTSKQLRSQGNTRRESSRSVTASDFLSPILAWLLDIAIGALHAIKTPLKYALAVWLLFGLGTMLRNLVTNSIYASLSPICRIPGSSLLQLPFCLPPDTYRDDVGSASPAEFDELIEVQSKFEDVLAYSAGGATLPLDMKRGEASIRDLRQLVRFSNLHSRNELVFEFGGFVDTARIAAYDLQRFNSHIGRAVDSVLATTRWTTRVLDGIAIEQGSRGAVQAFISDRILAPFQPVRLNEDAVLDQYIQHTRVVEEEIHRLIGEAQALLLVLNNLEDRLDVIHGIVARDDLHVKRSRDEILSELWTMVGGNRGKLKNMDRQAHLLQQVGVYRKTAYAHVSGTIVRLQAMGAGLEDLRERVAVPELTRGRSEIPLSVHIEHIQRGVERLESRRDQTREMETSQFKERLEQGPRDERLVDG